MNYDMSKYGESITNEIISGKIANDLLEIIDSEGIIELDFANVNLLTTTCIKKIFGNITKQIPAELFFNRFCFKNASADLKTIISHGLEDLY